MQDQYALLAGQDLQLFIDRDIVWGEQWRERIEQALATVTFFIPVVTPRYFTRDECRRELLKFASEAKSLGVEELLLPILYVEVPNLDEGSSDPAIAVVASTQYVDWTSLRLKDLTSPEHREGVHVLARRLIAITETVGSKPVDIPETTQERLVGARETLVRLGGSSSSEDGSSLPDDDAPGMVEVLADAEGALPKLAEAMSEMTEVMKEISATTDEGAQQIQKSDELGKDFTGRVVVAHNLARKLDNPSNRMLALASQYAQALLDADAGVGTLIELAGSAEGSDREGVCQLFASIKELAEVSRSASTSSRTLYESFGETAQLSRELRPPSRKLQEAVQHVMDGQAVIAGWEQQVNSSPLDCDDLVASA
ncbi:MAG: TIR domain-containing protein [Gaiellaceae bacterium]